MGLLLVLVLVLLLLVLNAPPDDKSSANIPPPVELDDVSLGNGGGGVDKILVAEAVDVADGGVECGAGEKNTDVGRDAIDDDPDIDETNVGSGVIGASNGVGRWYG